jgi:hypothetical protein
VACSLALRAHAAGCQKSAPTHNQASSTKFCPTAPEEANAVVKAVLKMGTKVKSIHLGSGDYEVDCKMNGGSFMLKACFLKKA